MSSRSNSRSPSPRRRSRSSSPVQQSNQNSSTPAQPAASEVAALYVRNLSSDVKQEDLRTLFGAHGEVVLIDMKVRFAFVHMATLQQQQAALKAINGSRYRDRELVVELAKSKVNQARGPVSPCPRLFVVGFDGNTTTSGDLDALFGKFGAVRSVDFKTTFAFVEFREQAQATAALEALNKSDLKGHTLVVEYMQSKTSARSSNDRRSNSSSTRRRSRSPPPPRHRSRSPRRHDSHRDRHDRHDRHERHERYDRHERYESSRHSSRRSRSRSRDRDRDRRR